MQGFWLTPYTKNMSKEERAQTINAVMGLIKDKVIQPEAHAGKVYRLAEFAEALKESNAPGRGGKVFLSS